MVNYATYAAPRLDLGEAFMEHMAALDEFIAPLVLPVFRTTRKSASFSAITRETLLQDPAALRAPRSGYNRINLGAEDKKYDCPEYGLEEVVDDSERSLYANDFDAEDASTKMLARALMLKWESRVATAIFNTTTWTGATLFTDNSGAPWDAAASDSIAHVTAAKEKVRALTGMRPNALIISEAQLNNLLVQTVIKDRFPGAAVITEQMIRANLGAIFGLTKLIVGGAVKNTGAEGQAFSGSDVWSDDYAMVALVADPGAPLQTPCVGRSFLWVPDSPLEVTMETYREEQSRGDVVRARHSMDELVIDPSYGHLMKVDA